MKLVTVKPNLTEVTTPNIRKYINPGELIDGDRTVVYSYSTPVIVRMRINPSSPMRWYVTRTKHSNTTTRHIKYYLTQVYAMRKGDWEECEQSFIDELAE